MIHESSYWKDDLLKIAKNLKKRRQQKRFSERSLANIEKEMFFSFFVIRKLIESKKIADSTTDSKIIVYTYRSKGKGVTYYNRHKIEELYNLDDAVRETYKVKNVCNLFMHSYVFILWFEESGGLGGVILSSDFCKNNKLYNVGVGEIIKLLNKVGNDYPSKVHAIYLEDKKDYIVSLR